MHTVFGFVKLPSETGLKNLFCHFISFNCRQAVEEYHIVIARCLNEVYVYLEGLQYSLSLCKLFPLRPWMPIHLYK